MEKTTIIQLPLYVYSTAFVVNCLLCIGYRLVISDFFPPLDLNVSMPEIDLRADFGGESLYCVSTLFRR